MAKRKIYIDKEFSAKEISQGKNFAKLLTEYKKISTPFYTKAPFILSAVVTTIAITGSIIYITYFSENNSTIFKNENVKNNIAASSHSSNTAAVEIAEKKQNENSAASTYSKASDEKNGTSSDKSNPKNNIVNSSSIGETHAGKKDKKKPIEQNKNTTASKSLLEKEKTFQENNNVTAQTADTKNKKSEVKTKPEQLNKNNPSDDNLNSSDKQSANIPANQKQKNSDEKGLENSNPEATSAKNNLPATKDAVQNNISESSSEKPVVKEKETKTESDKPVIVNNEIKNVPDSSSSVNAVNNIAVPSNSVKNTDTTKYELAAKADLEKSFNKRKIVISGGIGLGAYGTLLTVVNDGNTKKDGAASALYSLAGEYGVAKWIGVGAIFSFDNYFVKRDSTIGTIPNAHSLNYSGFVNFHFVRHKRFDLLAGVSIGYSRFVIKWKDVNNTKAIGNGSLFGLYVVPRFYFNDRFGMFTQISLAGFNYTSFEIKNNSTQPALSGTFIGNGLNITIGAQMKF